MPHDLLPWREEQYNIAEMEYIGEMDSRFWNGLSGDFRRFWKERLSIEMFRSEAYMAVLELRSI